MRKTKLERRAGNPASRIFKHIAAQNWNELGFVKMVCIPGKRRAGEQHRPACRQRLRMPAVAPIGDEITEGAEFLAGIGSRAQIRQRVVVTSNQRLPSRSSGTDVKRNLRLCELRRFLFKRMICFVAPIQSDEVRNAELRFDQFIAFTNTCRTGVRRSERGQFWNQLRIFQNDVAPEHHFFAARGNFAVNLFQEIQIDPTFAAFIAKLFALAAAQIPGLVAADVEEFARKVRQQFIVKTVQKREGAGMIRRQRRRPADKFAARVFVRLGNFRELLQ